MDYFGKSTYIIEKDHARIQFENSEHEILIDLELVYTLRHNTENVLFTLVKGKPLILCQGSDGSLMPFINWIVKADPSIRVTFKNRNILDLRSSNLLKEKKKKKTSPKGVSYSSIKNQWTASLSHKTNRYYLGRHETEELN
jgi:hypothetical protein